MTVVLTTSPVGCVLDHLAPRDARARARCFFSAPPPPTAHRVSLHGLTPSFVPATSTHPSTRVLEEVFASIARFAGAGACAKVIVADGVKTREGDDAQSKFRSGIVTRDAEKKYRHYLRRVKRLTLTPSSVLHGAQLLILDQRHGFAHALRRGICRAVKTPFVLVAQHDRSFVRAVDLTAVVDAMCVANEASPLETGPLVGLQTENKNAFRLNYVGFPTSTTVTHARHVLSKYALEIAPFEAPTSSDVTDASFDAKLSSDVASRDAPPNPKTENVALLPLLQFYDSMHVASTRWYLSRVFGRERYCTLPKGGFIEDTLGQLMLRTARDAARAARVAGDAAEKKSVGDDKKKVVDAIRDAHRPFGAYVRVASLDPDKPGDPVCGHIDGRDSRLADGANRKFWFEEWHTSEEAWGELERNARNDDGDDDECFSARDVVPGFFDPPDAVALPEDVWI